MCCSNMSNKKKKMISSTTINNLITLTINKCSLIMPYRKFFCEIKACMDKLEFPKTWHDTAWNALQLYIIVLFDYYARLMQM